MRLCRLPLPLHHTGGEGGAAAQLHGIGGMKCVNNNV